ncbi:MAG TPA: hypothetical protein VKY51_07875 [Fredinandcohnia sp.]|nr:hypothetical protein [Fredinandcohnia sp.]
MKPFVLAFVGLAFAFASTAEAEAAAPRYVVDDSTGTRFEETIRVGDTTFRCIGAGVRKVLFFKAYAAAFCLDARRFDAVVNAWVAEKHGGKAGEDLARALEKDGAFFEHLENADANKLVIMQLVRDVSKDRIAGAFRSSLSEVLPEDRVEKLIATIPGDGKDGQRILIHSRGSTLVIDIAGDAKRLDDDLIARKLWRVWLGPDSVTPSLKSSIARTLAR